MWQDVPCGTPHFVHTLWITLWITFLKNNLKNVRKIAPKCYTFRKWKRGGTWGQGRQTPCVNAGHFSNFENDFLYIPFKKHFENI